MSENDKQTLDAEDWEIAFKAYEENSVPALDLAFRFVTLKTYLLTDAPNIQAAIEAIDCAIDVLFPHTQFYGVSQELYLKLIEGKLKTDEEQMLKGMGVQF